MAGRVPARVVMLLAAALLASGCSSTISGAAKKDPDVVPPTTTATPGPAAPTAPALLGDPRTVDACSLLRPAALAEFGTVAPGAEESFDYCRVDVDTEEGGTAAVRFGELEIVDGESDLRGLGATEDPTKDGPLRFFEIVHSDEECERRVLFADDATMKITADVYDTPDEPVEELCDIVEAAADRVAASLLAGDGAEHVTYPGNSLATLDACSLLSDATVTAVLGAPPTRTVYPAGHVCRWGTFPHPSLSVRFAKGERLTGDGVTEETIAGRPTSFYTLELSSYVICAVEAGHVVRSELAQVLVRKPPGQAAAACDGARAVAAETWPALPA